MQCMNEEELKEQKPAEKIIDVGEEQESVYVSPLLDEKPGSIIAEILRKNRCGFYGGSY